MIETVAFGVGLTACLFFSARVGGRRIRETAGVLSAVWLLNLTWAVTTGLYDSWYLMAVIDAAAAYTLLSPPCRPARMAVGVIFIGQIIWHGVYGFMQLRGLEGSRDTYLFALTVMGWSQMVALLLGAGSDYGKRRFARRGIRGGHSNSVAAASAHDEQQR